jgi:hypothetical protein
MPRPALRTCARSACCKAPNSDPVFDGYCAWCFYVEFPDHARTREREAHWPQITWSRAILELAITTEAGLAWQFERSVCAADAEGKARRADLFVRHLGSELMVEIDAHQKGERTLQQQSERQVHIETRRMSDNQAVSITSLCTNISSFRDEWGTRVDPPMSERLTILHAAICDFVSRARSLQTHCGAQASPARARAPKLEYLFYDRKRWNRDPVRVRELTPAESVPEVVMTGLMDLVTRALESSAHTNIAIVLGNRCTLIAKQSFSRAPLSDYPYAIGRVRDGEVVLEVNPATAPWTSVRALLLPPVLLPQDAFRVVEAVANMDAREFRWSPTRERRWVQTIAQCNTMQQVAQTAALRALTTGKYTVTAYVARSETYSAMDSLRLHRSITSAPTGALCQAELDARRAAMAHQKRLDDAAVRLTKKEREAKWQRDLLVKWQHAHERTKSMRAERLSRRQDYAFQVRADRLIHSTSPSPPHTTASLNMWWNTRPTLTLVQRAAWAWLVCVSERRAITQPQLRVRIVAYGGLHRIPLERSGSHLALTGTLTEWVIPASSLELAASTLMPRAMEAVRQGEMDRAQHEAITLMVKKRAFQVASQRRVRTTLSITERHQRDEEEQLTARIRTLTLTPLQSLTDVPASDVGGEPSHRRLRLGAIALGAMLEGDGGPVPLEFTVKRPLVSAALAALKAAGTDKHLDGILKWLDKSFPSRSAHGKVAAVLQCAFSMQCCALCKPKDCFQFTQSAVA